ncbi:MAG: hypothetical protein KGP28_09925 [Bdellovibrionales bacterium]|nr:hypothetical protein [Bdellovibrionales bacterium]
MSVMMKLMKKVLMVLLMVAQMGLPSQAFADSKDIIPSEKKFPGRYIGTPIIKKNGVDYIQFQDCSVARDAKNPHAMCRAIVEVPSDVLKKYIKCTRGDLEFDKNLSMGIVAVSAVATNSGVPLAMLFGGLAGGTASYILGEVSDELDGLNVAMKEEQLVKNIDYEANVSADKLVERIEDLYGEITQSSCFENSERTKLRSRIILYGNLGPKKKVTLKGQKFYSLTGVKEQAPKASARPSTGISSQTSQMR